MNKSANLQHSPINKGMERHKQEGSKDMEAGGGNNQRTYRKYYNNWNMCYSCGFDVPLWHTSKTCPQECRRAGHQENCDRGNYKGYLQAGHNVRVKKEDAHILPTNPGPHQA